MRAETKEVETATKKYNEIIVWFLEEASKINKLSAKLIKTKKENTLTNRHLLAIIPLNWET